MGNDINLSKADKNEKKQIINIDSFKLYSTEVDSSYNGVKTCIGDSDYRQDYTKEGEMGKEKEKEKEKLELTTDCSTGNLNENCTKQFKIPTKFEWKEGGNIVYVVGNFNNWGQWFIMNNQNGDCFELTLELPLGTYQYKFIVDQQWRFSQFHPTIEDNQGNINNIIDNSLNIDDLLNSKTTAEDEEDEMNNHFNHKNSIELNKNFNIKKNNDENQKGNSKREFSTRNSIIFYTSDMIPAKDEMNLDANNAPKNYIKSFSLNNFHVFDHIKGKEHFFENYNKIYFASDSSYKKTLNTPPHININHMISKVVPIIKIKRENILSISSSYRARNKHITVVYYKPIRY